MAVIDNTVIKNGNVPSISISLVTYHTDTGSTFTRKVKKGLSVLNETASKSGYTFVGWKQESKANPDVETSLVASGQPMDLYAVFHKTLTTSFVGNGGSGTTASLTSDNYYNNGVETFTAITLPSSTFTNRGYTFNQWHLGSASGTAYAVGAVYQPLADTVFYAEWTDNSYEFALYRADDTTKLFTRFTSYSSDSTYSQDGPHNSVVFDTKGCKYLTFIHRGDGNQVINVYNADTSERIFNWGAWEAKSATREVIDVSSADRIYLDALSGATWGSGYNDLYKNVYTDAIMELTNTHP